MKSITDTKNTGKLTTKCEYLQPVLCPWCQGTRCCCCLFKGYTYRKVA